MNSIKDLKRTKLGLIFLMSAAGAYTLGMLGSVISCVTLLMNLAALGLGITAIVFLLMGARSYGTGHKLMTIASVVLVGVALVIRLFVLIMMISAIFSSFAGAFDDTTGQEFIDMMESMKPFIIMLVVPYLMMAAALVLPALKITPAWGKIFAGIFGFMVIIGLAVMVMVQIQNIDSIIDEMEADREYETEEIQELQQDRAMTAWASILLLGGVHILSLIVILGALMENSKRIKEESSKQQQPMGIYNLEGPLV